MARRNIDRQALRQQIQELDIDNELKSQLLDAVSEQKKYGLVWENHKEDAEELLREKIPVLKEEAPLRLSPGGEGSPNHILIEGDNLHALTALTYTHEGKVDVIYIDPPYNTGKEFIYNDKLVDTEDGYKHSKWLSFMSRRLRIAHKLLSDRGVILISIDNHELYALKELCDEIFNPNNFITNFVWHTEGHTDNQEAITDVHEYILCYSKKTKEYVVNDIVDPNVDISSKILRDFAENSITKNGKKNPPSEIELPKGFPCEIENLIVKATEHFDQFRSEAESQKFISRELTAKYSVTYPVKIDDMQVNNFMLSERCRVYSGWASAGNLQRFINNKFEPIKEDGGTVLRYYLSKNGVIYYRREGRASHYIQTVLENMGTTETNKYMLERMNVIFEYPKPIELIYYLLKVFALPNSTILDFFAGSGTTMHATMLLNREEGNRQCISVQNNYNNICKSNYNRNKWVIEKGHSLPSGEKIEALLNNNLRYYKVDFVDRENTSANRKRLMQLSTDLLCIKENIYNEVQFTIDGKTMKKDFVRYFAEGDNRMLVVYDPRAISYIVDELRNREVEGVLKVYVYSDGQYAYNDEFSGLNVELCALPDAIYQALNRVLPEKKEEAL